ncbi:MAG: methyl-accepting chemotaxis protein [Sphingomonadales bacterium]|nr:methyl-accepting chemotaxis protein [Sphingomonadales bacterium]
MFSSLKIPRKLVLSFAAINLSAAVMMLVFAANILMINRSTERTNFSQSILAKSLALETALLRQNSQMRGYLVTADDSYLKSYYEGRDEYDRTSAELEKLLDHPDLRALLLTSRDKTQAWRANWGDKSIAMVKSGQRDAAQQSIREGGKAALVSEAVLPLRGLRDHETKAIAAESERQSSAIVTAWVALGLGGVALLALAISLSRWLSRDIARPVSSLTHAMNELAAGHNTIQVDGVERADELGDMARAVVVFREAALAKVAADADRERAMAEIGEKLHELANSNLRARLHGLPPAFGGLASDFNDALDKLCEVMTSVRGSVDAIATSSAEIRQATADLSNRSEDQAARLQASATAMAEITHKVGESASLAASVNRSVLEARSEAEQGGAVVQKAIEAMQGIDQATREITEIISVIDGIAFQTNLLALNAGVEAARAGDAGKGFAVVASEVRALAQRAGDAASDVKNRIMAASGHVVSGVELVNETGGALGRIIDRVASVSSDIESMAEAAEQQSGRLKAVNDAISAMDTMTQQNAAMVEQTTAATRSLAGEAQQLIQAFGIFNVGDARPIAAPPPVIAAPAPAPARPRAAPRPAPVSGNLALKSDEDWSEF